MALILVVEDDPDVRGVVSRILTEAGHSVVAASNGNEALLLIESQRFALVVVDILMPERDGFETIRVLKEMHPRLKIIAISGAPRFGSYNPLEAAVIFGAHQSISKPFDAALLLKLTDDLLSAVD